MSRWRAFTGAILVLAGLAAPAAARDKYRDRDPDYYRFERDGFLIGFSLGFGSSHPCDECPGLGGSFMVGGMAEEDLAIVFEMSGVGSEENRREQGLGLATISARYWPHYKIWLQGGVGIGFPLDEEFDFDDDRGQERDWAAMAGAGYEIVQRHNFTFDVGVRGGIAGDRKSVALTLGFNWY